ncbi:MAG TPA: hypothetical protein PKE03_10220 [Bacteroidales bacterium]|nr:hypothetical protein [Bacteroidales bacterium]
MIETITIDIMKANIATVVGNDISIYRPYLITGLRFLEREILGPEMTPYLIEDNAALLSLAQAVVCHKAYLDAIPFLDLVQTESGFAIVRTDNLTPASTERVKALIAATSERLTECIEDLLEWLENHADTEIETVWKASKTYTIINDNYVRSIREFRTYGEFSGGRLDWIRFRPKLANVRRLKIEPVISRELSEAIIEALRDDDLAGPMKIILDDLRYALASFANDDEMTGQNYLSRVRDYLIAHPDDFTEFSASDIYQKYLASKPRDISSDPFMVCGV